MSRSHQRSFAIAKRQVEFLALFQIESENWNSFNAIEFRRSRMDVPRCVLQRRERILCVSWAGQIMSEEQNLRRRLAAEPFDVFITADKNLGVGVGIQHTPTIYVVSNKTQGKPFVEVVDRSKLFELIDTMKRE